MATSNDQNLVANATETVLDRLEALQLGDTHRVAEIDANTSKDPLTVTALWSAAFGIAERCLNVIRAHDPAEAERVMQSFRDQVRGFRSQ